MLSFLFRKKIEKDPIVKTIEKFIEEHKSLVDLYVEILTLAKEKKCLLIRTKLASFENILLQHIQDEKEEIYLPLNDILDPNKDSALVKEINKIKSDIVPIKKKINIINLKYRNLNEKNIDNFIDDFSYLKEPILARIELEEKKLFMYFEKKTKKR